MEGISNTQIMLSVSGTIIYTKAFGEFLLALGALNDVMPLLKLECSETATNVFSYECEAKDGKKLEQSLRSIGVTETELISEASGYWKLSELGLHGNVSEKVIELISLGIKEIKINYL